MRLFVQEPDSQEPVLVSVREPGEVLASLLSVADILCGNDGKFKTLSARASKPTTVIRIPVTHGSSSFLFASIAILL